MTPASCSLDEAGLSLQLRRYRAVGESASVAERSARRIALDVDGDFDGEIRELIAVENECCPFFGFDWDPEARRFAVSVDDAVHEPALDAIAYALGISA